jgi:lysophospholipase L1-like esterase
METYLTVCVPELNVSVRQYGWSGEQVPGFLHRMTNDCLRFKPTIATTCYGMNDHRYRAYDDWIGQAFRTNSDAMIQAFKAAGVRVIEGSPGCVGKRPSWTGDPKASVDDMNLNLCQLRNIALEVARKDKVGFADIFWPMLTSGHATQLQYGPDFTVSGKDGVHPGWAGHLEMAYAFLHAFGLDGNIGTFTIYAKSGKAKVSAGHDLVGFNDGELKVISHRYPFCTGQGDPSKSDNLYAGTRLVPFDPELNRFVLVVKSPAAKSYRVTWGDQSKSFSSDALGHGINLAEEFPENPFSESFAKVDKAVAAKQAFETKQIKEIFHGHAGQTNMEAAVADSEKQRDPLVAAVKAAFVPVTHVIKITPE